MLTSPENASRRSSLQKELLLASHLFRQPRRSPIHNSRLSRWRIFHFLRTRFKIPAKFLPPLQGEWHLLNAQNFLGETLAATRVGCGLEDNAARELFHLLELLA